MHTGRNTVSSSGFSVSDDSVDTVPGGGVSNKLSQTDRRAHPQFSSSLSLSGLSELNGRDFEIHLILDNLKIHLNELKSVTQLAEFEGQLDLAAVHQFAHFEQLLEEVKRRFHHMGEYASLDLVRSLEEEVEALQSREIGEGIAKKSVKRWAQLRLEAERIKNEHRLMQEDLSHEAAFHTAFSTSAFA